jgi:hypothetical protein
VRARRAGRPYEVQWGWLVAISALVWGVTLYHELS